MKKQLVIILFLGCFASLAWSDVDVIWHDDMQDTSDFNLAWLDLIEDGDGYVAVETQDKYGSVNSAVYWQGAKMTPTPVASGDQITFEFFNINKDGNPNHSLNVYTGLHYTDETYLWLDADYGQTTFVGYGPFEETRTIDHTGTVDAVYWKIQGGAQDIGKQVSFDDIQISTPHRGNIGWYDNLVTTTTPADIAASGGNEVFLYADYFDPDNPTQVARLDGYLDAAQTNGIRVVLSVKQFVMDNDTTALADTIARYKYHPALSGWYTADEPNTTDYPISNCETAYNMIKQASDKPVYIAFHTAGVDNDLPEDYADAYDVMMFDKYPFSPDDDEFEGLKSEYFLWWKTRDGWIDRVGRAHAAANDAGGKPLRYIVQAFGTTNWRLPTYAEERFMVFFSRYKQAALSETGGIVFYADHQLENSAARPSCPYPYDGEQWMEDVGEVIMEELDVLGPALETGHISGGVTNEWDFPALVFQDPETEEYYMIAMHRDFGTEIQAFTLDIDGVTFMYADPLFEERPDIQIFNGRFSDSFSSFGVHTYHLVHAPEPATMMLLGAGVVMVILRRKRKP